MASRAPLAAALVGAAAFVAHAAPAATSIAASRALGLRPVLWTTWGRDWRASATPRSVAADVEAELAPGATVLLHDSDCTSDPGSWRSALGALPLLAERFGARGYRVGPLAEHGVNGRSPG